MNLTGINMTRNKKGTINQDREPWQGIEGRKTKAKEVVETGRRGDRWLERKWWANSQRSRQTTREKGCQPVREEQTSRQAGRQTP